MRVGALDMWHILVGFPLVYLAIGVICIFVVVYILWKEDA